MIHFLKTAFLAAAVMGLAPLSIFAQASQTNPNGYPIGEPFSFSLIGKREGFVCKPETGEIGKSAAGNIVFVPEAGEGDIWLKSGSAKKPMAFMPLQVTDPCTSTFDGTAAEVQIPAVANGYWVYARALRKFTDNPFMKIKPGIVIVSSEAPPEDLVYLGTITAGGFYNALTGETITRAKGKNPVIPINTLFDWRGYVCYSTDPVATLGMPDFYEYPVEMCLGETSEIAGLPDENGNCSTGRLTGDLYCHYYSTTWIFNIADFVTYLWDADSSGTKSVQIRLYPR